MSYQRMVTERQAIERERKAWAAGAGYLAANLEYRDRLGMASEKYPMPQVERPRVVVDPHDFKVFDVTRVHWKVCCGAVVQCFVDGRQMSLSPVTIPITPERAALFADLLALPTEWVEEEAP